MSHPYLGILDGVKLAIVGDGLEQRHQLAAKGRLLAQLGLQPWQGTSKV